MNAAKIKRDLNALAKLDGDVARGLKEVSYPEPRIREQGFQTFLSTLVGQQISTDAAAAIMARVRLLLPTMSAEAMLALEQGALRAAGLSGRKVEYAEGLARAIVDGSFNVSGLGDMDNAAAISSITRLRGFGEWSAEIYIMFSLQREDVFPAGDLALRIALQKLKGIEHRLSEKESRDIVATWSPYRSAGSLFLWRFYRGAPT